MKNHRWQLAYCTSCHTPFKHKDIPRGYLVCCPSCKNYLENMEMIEGALYLIKAGLSMINRFVDTLENHDEDFDPPEIATVNVLRLTEKIITTLVNNISTESDYCDTSYAFDEARRKEHTSNHVIGKILEVEKVVPEVSPY